VSTEPALRQERSGGGSTRAVRRGRSGAVARRANAPRSCARLSRLLPLVLHARSSLALSSCVAFLSLTPQALDFSMRNKRGELPETARSSEQAAGEAS
jgi:hypothetical protein